MSNPHAEMEGQARAEWEERGFDPEHFHLDKMIEIWESEDMEEMAQQEALGHSRLAQKMDLIAASKAGLVDWEKVQENVIEKAVWARDKGRIAAFYVGRAMELPHQRKRRQLREHRQLITLQEGEASHQQHDRDPAVEALTRWAEMEKRKTRDLHLHNKKMRPIKKYREDQARMAAERDALAMREAYDKKENQWIFEKNEQLRVQREAADKKFKMQENYRRKMNDLYWGQHSRSLREDANKARSDLYLRRHDEHNSAIASELAEEEERERERWGYDGPAVSKLSGVLINSQQPLGVFGLPLAPGEFANPTSGGHTAGLDEHDVNLFTGASTSMPSYELRKTAFWELKSKVDHIGEKHISTSTSLGKIKDELQTLATTDELFAEQLDQLQHEEDTQLALQAGPPRRDPMEKEILASHDRKKRSKHILEKKKAGLHKMELLRKQEAKVIKQQMVLASRLAVGREEVAIEEHYLSEHERLHPELPMVVGRQLDKLPADLPEGPHEEELQDRSEAMRKLGLPPLKSKRAQDMVVARSKFEMLKAAAVPAQRAYRQARKTDIISWRLEEEQINENNELELLYSQLARIEQKLTMSRGENLRHDLISAFERWHLNNESLHPVSRKHSGTLTWWTHHVMEQSADCMTCHKSGEGIKLGHANFGVCQGIIKFPKHALWKIRLLVTKEDEHELDQGHADDFCVVKLGQSLSTVSQVGKYLNRRTPGQQGIHYDVQTEVVGAAVAFRFEFDSQELDPTRHMCVMPGYYEEAKVKPLEQQPGRVISSFVKMLRVEQQMGKQRAAALLEELVRVKDSATETWDSALYHHGVLQRFDRGKLKKLLHGQLEDETKKQMDEKQRVNAQRQAKREYERLKRISEGKALPDDFLSEEERQAQAERVMFDDSVTQEEREILQVLEYDKTKDQRLDESKDRYWKRKAEKAQRSADTESGRLLVGKKLQVWDKVHQVWRVTRVNDYRFKWVDHGTVLQKKWLLQRELEGGLVEEEQEWLDIALLRYNILETDTSAVERKRMEAMARYEEKKRKEEEAAAQERATQREDVHRVQAGLGTEDLSFQESRSNALAQCRTQAESAVEQELKSSKGKAELKRAAHDIQERHRQGLDSPTGRGTFITLRQAQAEAKDNFVNVRVRTVLEQHEAAWESRSEVYATKRAKRLDEGMRRVELRRLDRQRLREQKHALANAKVEAAKAELQRKLVIPPELFAKARMPHYGCCADPNPRVKSWGSKYSQGVRCANCGKELSRSHQEADAAVGGNPELDALVQAHRKNEAGFRFESEEQLRMVEAERVRLEKERREEQLLNQVWYDNGQMKCLREFDLRHKIGADAGMQLDGCPTFRANDIRHKAEYHDLLNFFGRINAFRRRIGELGDNRSLLKSTQWSLVEQLKKLHTELPKMEERLALIEEEHRRAHEMLQQRRDITEQLEEATAALTKMLNELEQASLHLVGRAEKADQVETEHRAMVKTLHEALKQRMASAKRYQFCVKRTKQAHGVLKKSAEDLEKAVQVVVSLQYRRRNAQILTPYGRSRVLLYREEDCMLVCRLPFGSGRLYIPVEKVVQLDQRVQQAELVGMRQAEDEGRQFYEQEAALIKAEEPFWASEERETRMLMRFEKMQKREDAAVKVAVARADEDAVFVLGTDMMKSILKGEAKAEVAEINSKRIADIKKWKAGNNSLQGVKMPKKISLWRRHKMVQTRVQAKRKEFYEEQMKMAEEQTKQEWEHRRNELAKDQTFAFIIDSIIGDMIPEVAREAKHESELMKERAEEESAIIFNAPDIGRMQFGIYHRLRSQWVKRKHELRSMMITWGSMGEEARQRRLEEERKREEELRTRKERRVLLQRCEEMRKEEEYMRAFMLAEVKLTLDERRYMDKEEKFMRKFLEEEKAEAALKAQQAKMGISSGPGAKKRSNKPTKNEGKRTNIKQRKLEKRRLAREWAQMEEEDALAKQMRLEQKREEMKQKMKEEEMLIKGGGGEEEEDEDGDASSSEEESDSEAEPEFDSDEDVGDEAILDSDSDEPSGGGSGEAAPPPENETEKDKNRREKKERKAKMKARMRAARSRKRNALQAEQDNRLTEQIVEAVMIATEIDLKRMEEEEECKWAEYEERLAKSNAEKYALYSQGRGQAELRKRRGVKQLRLEADQAKGRYEKAVGVVSEQRPVVEDLEINHKLVYEATEWMDSYVTHATHAQRLKTTEAYHILHRQYFRTIVIQLGVRAEVVASERSLMQLNYDLQENAKEEKSKAEAEATLWGKHRRGQLMRLKRLELGKLMFGRSQHRLMELCFVGWVRYWAWRMSVRGQFTLKVGLEKHNRDLARAVGQMDAASERQLHGADLRDEHEANSTTIMKRHQGRVMQCRNSGQLFTEGQNQATFDTYHPGKYEVACPNECPHCDESGMPTTKCMSNRVKRWTCCDQRKEGAHGDNGCAFRYKMPPPEDPVYKKLVKEVTARDAAENKKIKEGLDEVRRNDWENRTRRSKFDMLQAVAEDMVEERKIIDRFKLLPPTVADRHGA